MPTRKLRKIGEGELAGSLYAPGPRFEHYYYCAVEHTWWKETWPVYPMVFAAVCKVSPNNSGYFFCFFLLSPNACLFFFFNICIFRSFAGGSIERIQKRQKKKNANVPRVPVMFVVVRTAYELRKMWAAADAEKQNKERVGTVAQLCEVLGKAAAALLRGASS